MISEAELRRDLAKLRRSCAAPSRTSIDLSRISFAEFIKSEFLNVVRDIERPHPFVPAPHLEKWAELIEHNPFVGIISFRGSLKSVIAKGAIAYALRNHRSGIFDAFYFSASQRLAGEHVERLKMYTDVLARRWGWEDLTEGRTLLRYRRGDALFLCKPDGVDAHSRGRRSDLFVIDDIVDPKKAVTMVDVMRAIEAVSERLIPILKNMRSKVLFCGTPIIRGDVVSWIMNNPAFKVVVFPIRDQDGRPSWPEAFPEERIRHIRNAIGERSFRVNYELEPVELTGNFIDANLLDEAMGVAHG